MRSSDWSSDVCSSDLFEMAVAEIERLQRPAEPTDRTAHAEVVALRLRCPQQVRAGVIGASLVAIRVLENDATPDVLDTRLALGLEAYRSLLAARRAHLAAVCGVLPGPVEVPAP